MDSLWIIHRDPRLREALRQLAGAGPGVRSGGPEDRVFDGLGVPPVVVLGLASDPEPALEAELDFARIHGSRRPDTRFVLVRDPALPPAAVEALFAGLAGELLAWPPAPGALRQALARARAPRPLPLEARRLRSRLERQGARFFQDLDLPRALDRPGRGANRALVRGEPGSGRLLLTRLLHARGRSASAPFVALACEPDATSAGLAAQLRALLPAPRAMASTERAMAATGAHICLEEVDRLPQDVQRSLAAWIELGDGPLAGRQVTWSATAGPETPWLPLEAVLESCLGRLVAELPPLRDRTALIEPFLVVLVAEWASREGQPAPAFSSEALAALCGHAWPGNLREFESVVLRALEQAPGDPVEADDLALVATGAWAGATEATAEPSDLLDAEEALEALGSFGADDPLPPLEVVEVDGSLDEVGDAAERRVGDSAERLAGDSAERLAGGAAEAPLATDTLEAPSELPKPVSLTTPATAASAVDESPLLARLARALAHEVRNPLTAVRTFTQLLPERFDDPEFRGQFREQVDDELGRIERLVSRLDQLADLGEATRVPVDVTGLLEELLEERRPEIQDRRLLVLQEFDTTRPLALGDPELLRVALSALMDRALAWVPERADLFVASKYHPVGPEGAATVRILLRFYNPARPTPRPGAPATRDVALGETSFDVILAEQALRAQGGTLRLDDTQADETVLVIDLQAAS